MAMGRRNGRDCFCLLGTTISCIIFYGTFRQRACVPSAACTLKLMVLLSIAQALELSGDFHTGAAKVYDGLAHLKGTPPTKSAAEMAQELATKASQKLEVKQALRGPVDLDF